MSLRFLVVDGSPREGRETHEKATGHTGSEGYAEILRGIVPDAACSFTFPADEGAGLPARSAIADFDAVVWTGSGLHVEDMSPPVTRQLDLLREVLAAGVPAFGSCWGVQVAGVVAGGQSRRNPKGPEYGFARRISLTEEGRRHPLMAGRPAAFDAPAIHLDAVVTPPPDCTVLASNDVLPLQAVEIRHGGGVFWGTQYHPEFNLTELGLMIETYAHELVDEGLVLAKSQALAFAEDLQDLGRDRGRLDLQWRHGVDPELMDDATCRREIANFVERIVKPSVSERGRA
jgi:GMP synthase (glutamine-hydrolysing)